MSRRHLPFQRSRRDPGAPASPFPPLVPIPVPVWYLTMDDAQISGAAIANLGTAGGSFTMQSPGGNPLLYPTAVAGSLPGKNARHTDSTVPNTFIDSNAVTTNPGTGSFTFALHSKIPMGGNQFIYSARDAATLYGYDVLFDTGSTLQLVGRNPSPPIDFYGFDCGSGSHFDDGAWHNVGVVADRHPSPTASGLSGYCDGVLIGFADITSLDSINLQHFTVTQVISARLNPFSTVYTTGTFAEWCYWNLALSPAQMLTLYSLRLRGISLKTYLGLSPVWRPVGRLILPTREVWSYQ